ncbi:CoxG family protein [Natrinema gelatinilyticum]|uniref:CoxG family protein n=1 Tax=Natrinema gelatinilyticum TaxID=2961571 RepID=UPI0020C21ABF|nr:carbon monoxide dehydrogenase subunit G [Natrinema gelatinilyticum]
MTMEFDGEFESDRPPEELWDYFTDTGHLSDCAPGLDEMNMLSESEFEATITVGVGSVKPTFSVDGVVVEADKHEKLVMSMEGSAGRKGAFNAVGTMTMHETDDGTCLEWVAVANVSGLISSLGQRALGSVTKRLVGQFFDDMEEKINSGVPAESKLAAAEDAEATVK